MSLSRTLSFGPLRIAYDDRVLEPRPWTFAQSQWAAEILRDTPPGPILELCSGAGQIGLAAALLTGRDVVLVDASEAACEISVRNAADAGLGGRVEVRLDGCQASFEIIQLAGSGRRSARPSTSAYVRNSGSQ
mgnify:CR=1 FL=1